MKRKNNENEEFYFQCQICGEQCIAEPDLVVDVDMVPDDDDDDETENWKQNLQELQETYEGVLIICRKCQEEIDEEND